MRRENQTLMDELSRLICKTDQVTPCFNALLHLILSRKLDLVLLTDCSHDRWQKTEATQNSCSSWAGPNLWMQMTCTGMFARLLSYSKRILVGNETRRAGRLNYSVMHFKKWDLVQAGRHRQLVFFWDFDFATCLIIMVCIAP